MFDCPHCGQRHDRDVNGAINIRNEGLRILALGTSASALGGNVRPKRYGRLLPVKREASTVPPSGQCLVVHEILKIIGG